MDVDLLRPGSVPISPDTVLWFEFLLNQDLLLNHLQKPTSDPSPIELIILFSNAVVETLRNRPDCDTEANAESKQDHEVRQPAKNIALKFLSLKVAAFIKWNIEQVRTLPLKTQISLLQDLLYFTNEKKSVEIPNVEEEEISSLSQSYLFALLIYHRWMLNLTVHKITSNFQQRTYEAYPVDENLICTPENVQKTVNFLMDALKWEIVPSILTFDCIRIPTEQDDTTDFDWTKSVKITKDELQAQINYDLGTFFFFKESYDLAKKHFIDCKSCSKNMKENNEFIDVNLDLLEVYLKTCSDPEEQKGDLLEQLNNSICNQYVGLISILQQDNISREIPLTQRIVLELDIQGALSSEKFTVARDFLYKVRALNGVRIILDKKSGHHYSNFSLSNFHNFMWAIQATWKGFSDKDKQQLKEFFLELILRNEVPNLYSTIKGNDVLMNIFSNADKAYIEKHSPSPLAIPACLNKTNWNIYDLDKKKKPKLELRQLEKSLIGTYDYPLIKELVSKMVSNLSSVWKVNPKWELPIPLQSVLKSLPRGFLQEFAFVMLAKAKEQMLNKSWNSSLELLIILDKELQAGSASKLTRLVSWELLLVQITQHIEDWPKSSIDKNALASACEACLQTSESVLPRTEITEQCVICLLNLGRWEFLINLEKRWNYIEISSAIALACQDLVKPKGNKKLPKTIWDLVLSVFISPTSKRSNTGTFLYQDNQIINLKNNIMSIFTKLRDSVTLTVIISLLTRLYNIVKDEPNQELQLDTIMLWPSVVSNASSYNVKMVLETLWQMVSQALTYYPTNISWLRLASDINFANGHYRVAMNYYLKSLVICNDYFDNVVRNDDHVFRRMIKCCSSLGCHTQAAILCQFLQEPDYALAFRILGDQKSSNDAVDSYYHCFWDTNILEFLIHVHNKKGEFQRRKKAIEVIGLLELNSSNNEEIQQEARSLRKNLFLRALCKQYLFQ